MRGIFSKTLDWVEHPQYTDATMGEWAAGLVLILIAAFLWGTIVKQMQ